MADLSRPGVALQTAQLYDTTITDCDSGLAVRCIVIPRGSMAPYVQGDLVEWAALLGLKSSAFLESAREMESVLSSILKPGDAAAAELAAFVVHQPAIPFPTDALAGASLLEIARSAGVPLVSVASLASGGAANLILVAVPAGVVVCGAAEGLEAALHAGLSARVREVMGLE